MAFKVNGLDVINDSSEVSNIIATTAEAEAGTNNDKVMTPLRTKEMIQGGTVSVIKSVQKFSLRMGEYNIGGTIYFNWGTSSSSTGFSYNVASGSMSVTSPGSAGSYVFVNLAQTVNLRKSFLTAYYSGDPKMGSAKVRLYSNSGYSGSSVQITTSDLIPESLYILQNNNAPNISVEVIEFY